MSTEPDQSEALYTELASTRITRATSAMVDTYAAREDRKRAHMLRVLIAEAVAARQRAEMSTMGPAKTMLSVPNPAATAVMAYGPHPFKPGQNPLKCGTCGVKAGDHR